MKFNKDNAMLMDVQYIRGSRKNNTPETLYMVLKDMDTHEKHLQIIEDPKMEIYFEKPEFRNHDYNKTYQYLTNVEKKVVPYSKIVQAIADDAGEWGKTKLRQIYETGNYKELEQFKLYPYVFGADYDIKEYYRAKWILTMDNNRPKEITKGFMDIEADGFEVARGLPNPSFCPVDLNTLIDGSTKKCYTFALVDVECEEKDMTNMTEKERQHELYRRRMYAGRIEQQHALMDDLDGLQEELHSLFDEFYGEMEYNFYFYTDERKMLAHIFQLINTLKLDFIEFWNTDFDMPYLIDRMKALGMSPEDIICHPDFPVKECYYKKDTKHFQVKERSSYFRCSGYTIYTDQMRNYAAIRKGSSELRSFKLSNIAQKEIGDSKYDYSESATNIKTLSFTNYRNYFIYNIKDVLLQYGIENVTDDLDTFYVTSYKNATPYEHVFKQTMKLRCVQYISYLSNGKVPGENINIFNYDNQPSESDEDEEDEKFEGALVGNPVLNDAFGMIVYGKKSSSIFRYSIDMDMSSFYPSTIIAMNIDPSTLIFKVIVDASQFDVRGGTIPYNGITDIQLLDKNKDSFVDDIAKEIFDNFQTRNYINTGHKFMNLPSIDDLYEKLMHK